MHRVADSMIVQLILASGSNAGIAAPIQRGYYMVGRHPECQIRPKTRSVSRRHCLLHHDENEFLVIDLGSTSGTRINEELVEAKQWHPLNDGDVLRLGKTVFNVSLQSSSRPTAPAPSESSSASGTSGTRSQARRSDAPAARTESSRPNSPNLDSPVLESPQRSKAIAAEPLALQKAAASPAQKSTASIVQGEAWQEFDVASFLQHADESDREQRYESIRQNDAARRAEELEDDGDIFEDTPLESDDASVIDGKSNVGRRGSEVTAPTASQAAKEAATTAVTTSATATRMAARRSDALPKKPSRLSRGISFARMADGDSLKTFLAVLSTLAVLSYAGYSAFRFVQGPTIEIVEGID